MAPSPGTAAIWNVATGNLLHVLWGHALPLYGVQVFPDGRRVVTIRGDSHAVIWDAASGQERALCRGGGRSSRTRMAHHVGALVARALGRAHSVDALGGRT